MDFPSIVSFFTGIPTCSTALTSPITVGTVYVIYKCPFAKRPVRPSRPLSAAIKVNYRYTLA